MSSCNPNKVREMVTDQGTQLFIKDNSNVYCYYVGNHNRRTNQISTSCNHSNAEKHVNQFNVKVCSQKNEQYSFTCIVYFIQDSEMCIYKKNTHTHTHAHTHIHTHTHARIRTYARTHTHAHARTSNSLRTCQKQHNEKVNRQ